MHFGRASLANKLKPDGSKTFYTGMYEVDKSSGGTVTKIAVYYPVGRAMRINISGGSNTLYYLLKDHLGSASVVTDASGTVVGEDRFYPYGETRFTTGTMYTDQLFTGQREMTGLGIYHYGARFYSPKLGRFLSPDTIVPGYTNPQAWNRYSYTLGNPLRYTDPSGHSVACNPYEDDCHDPDPAPTPIPAPAPDDIPGHHEDEDLPDAGVPAGWDNGVYCINSYCQFDGGTNIAWTLEDWPAMLFAGGAACLGTGLCIPAAVSAVNTGTNTVYRVVQDGRIIYIGITQNFAQRAAYWANARGWNPEPIRGLSENLSRFDARAVEQVLIENYGLANLENQINSIAATNPIYQAAIQRGNEILQIIGFGR
jgi:RHS repeat-associated protein